MANVPNERPALPSLLILCLQTPFSVGYVWLGEGGVGSGTFRADETDMVAIKDRPTAFSSNILFCQATLSLTH